MPLRKINVYVNVQTGNIVSSTGSVISSNEGPSVFLDDKVIFCIQLLNTDGTIYPLDESETLSMSLDNDFTHSTTLMAYSDNSMMNVAGDWIDESPTSPDTGLTPPTNVFIRGANKARGRISARMYFNTSSFATKIGSAKSLIAYLEMKKYTMAISSIIMQAKLTCKNIVNLSSGTPYTPGETYYTATQSDSRFIRLGDFNLSNPTEVSITAGTLVRDRSVHKVITSTNVNIDTITGAMIGYSVLIFTENIVNTITIRHGVGNILLPSGANLEMVANSLYMFNYDGTNWRCVLHNSNSDQLVKADSSDPTAGYLDAKIDNATIIVSNHAIKVKTGSAMREIVSRTFNGY